MRLADSLFRGGHLSEQALVDVCMSGDRPAHLDRCDICAERAVELGRWLDDVRATSNAVVDAAFPPERLAAQQTQIMRRLEQLDQPKRVIAFPNQYRLDDRQNSGRRVSPIWVGVGVAAGVLMGVMGGQISARFSHATESSAASAAPATPQNESAGPQTASVDWSKIFQREQDEQDHTRLSSLDPIDSATPRMVDEQQLVLAGMTLPRAGGGGR